MTDQTTGQCQKLRIDVQAVGIGVGPGEIQPAATLTVSRGTRPLITRRSGTGSQHDYRRCNA